MIGAGFVRMSSVLVLIAGLLGMHGLVIVGSAHMSAPSTVVSVAAPLHQTASTPMTALHDTAPSAETIVASAGEPLNAQHDGSPHSGVHQMLHLCLAVLAALLLVLAFVGLRWSLARLDVTSRVRIGNARREPPQRPPPTSTRLAQLCVMRN